MNSECDSMRDRIADLISGVLPETEAEPVAEHIGKCRGCGAYAEALQQEDLLLDGFVGSFGEEMSRREEKAIEALSRFETQSRSGVRMHLRSVLTKHAAAAVVVVVVGLYFAITFSWVTQITALIRYGL